MKRFIWALLFIPIGAISQPLHVTAWGGFAGYQGDLQSKRFTLEQSQFAFGVGLKYDITPHFAIRTGFNYGKVGASDSHNEAKLRERNLSFHSTIIEGNLLAEYAFLDMDSRIFTPYVFGGIGLYHFNPYAFDTLGNKIFLKPLSTEGQGLSQYPNSKEYKLTQFAIPFGAGVRLKVSETMTLGYELGLRKLFTDYLDDVSTRYIDQSVLAAERGAKAVEMAFRGGELKNSTATYPVDGTVRGGSEFKDWYYFHGITLTIGLNTSNLGSSKRGNTGCPKVL